MSTEIKIIRASDAFAYLPLYLAESYNLFYEAQVDHAHDGPYSDPKFIFESRRSETAGDVYAIDEMIDAVERGEIAFALGDPLEIFESKARDPTDLVVLGAIIKRPPFWIVKDQEARTIDELSISNIIFYNRETLKTGHYIGRFIADRKGLRDRSRITNVQEIGQELNLLIQKKKDGLLSCGALTADLLGMAKAHHHTGIGKCKPILRVFDQPEFRSFVTSDFITHKYVLRDSGEAARVLLSGIREATVLLQQAPSMIARLCRENATQPQFRSQLQVFENDARAQPLTIPESLWIAHRISDAGIYSTDLRISVEDWTAAAGADRWTGARPGEIAAQFRPIVEPGNALIENLPRPGDGALAGRSVKRPSRSSESVNGADKVLELLRMTSIITMEDHQVVGSYLRWDEQIVNNLRDWVTRIRHGLDKKEKLRNNFMIWAGPGSGKTYLIEEIARNSPGVDFIPINFAKVGQSNLQQELEKVQSLDAPTLVLLDEVDARPSEDWLYQSTLPRLDINIERPHGGQTVFVLIGSKRGGREAMIRAMVSPGGKGDDMVRRVPIANRFDIPAATIEDRLVILCSQARTPAPDVVEIEKLAAYYILRTPEYDNPRHLRDLVHAAVNKRSESLRLTYEDLFQRRDAAKRRFLTQNENAADELENTYIKIE